MSENEEVELTEQEEVSQEETEGAESEETTVRERKPKRNDVFKCPRCGSKVTVHVKLFDAPVCQNAKSHGSTAVTMEKMK